ncbi:MAG: hypothetical protein Q4F72_08030 [Desulfovibrionaceae bacterium]|nr:hypothetical protein [Desulfovibrionaceae bacterium]
MYGVMLFLLSYPVTRGLMRHGLLGCVLLALFLLHQLLNLGWYKSLPHGRWSFRRILLTVTDSLLVLSVLVLTASSLAMAGEVFPFAPFPMAWWSRSLHTAATAWTFVLASFHLGLHGPAVWQFVRGAAGRAWPVLSAALLFCGAYAFVQSGLWSDMVLYGEPKMLPEGPAEFVVQYGFISLFFCLSAHLVQGLAHGRKTGTSPTLSCLSH